MSETHPHYLPQSQGLDLATYNSSDDWDAFFRDCRRIAAELRARRAARAAQEAPQINCNQTQISPVR